MNVIHLELSEFQEWNSLGLTKQSVYLSQDEETVVKLSSPFCWWSKLTDSIVSHVQVVRENNCSRMMDTMLFSGFQFLMWKDCLSIYQWLNWSKKHRSWIHSMSGIHTVQQSAQQQRPIKRRSETFYTLTSMYCTMWMPWLWQRDMSDWVDVFSLLVYSSDLLYVGMSNTCRCSKITSCISGFCINCNAVVLAVRCMFSGRQCNPCLNISRCSYILYTYFKYNRIIQD